jgi:hypothetical protein
VVVPGAKGATALIAAVGEDPRLFKNGRGLAAWLAVLLLAALTLAMGLTPEPFVRYTEAAAASLSGAMP